MKIAIKILATALLALGVSSCYEDYKFDFEYTTTYFAQQKPFVKLLEDDSESLSLDAGVVLGGIYENSSVWEVDYAVDASLLDLYAPDKGFKLLPSDYYTVSDEDTMSVPSGDIVGRVTFSIDKAKFMNDASALAGEYVLPLKITSSDMDSILFEKDYTIIKLTYLNKYHGVYYLMGEDKNLTTGESVVYREADDEYVNNKRQSLTTNGDREWIVNYVGGFDSAGHTMKFTMGADDKSVTISAAEGSAITTISGSGSYDESTKSFVVSYTYTAADGAEHSVEDVLKFSNITNTDLRVLNWE